MYTTIAVLAGFVTLSTALASPPAITQLSADLEMKDFHDTASTSSDIEAGKTITMTFKNNAVVKVTLIELQEKVVKVKTQLIRNGGRTLYESTFDTKYNADAELSEKTPAGDLLYRLKLNPHIAEKN
jgi:hypothetical protein